MKSALVSAIFLIVTGIMLGAFGAHALETKLDADAMDSMNTGIDYQLYHGLALLALWLVGQRTGINLKTPMMMILAGVLMFSVSIYLLTCQDLLGVNLSMIWMVTPIGGGLMIAGWILVAILIIKWNMDEDV